MKGFFAKMMLGTMLTTVCLTGSALAATTETPAQNQENQTAMVEQQTEAAPVRVYGNVVEKGETACLSKMTRIRKLTKVLSFISVRTH